MSKHDIASVAGSIRVRNTSPSRCTTPQSVRSNDFSVSDMARLNPEADDDDVADEEFVDAPLKPSKRNSAKTFAKQVKQSPKRMLTRLDVLERYDHKLDADQNVPSEITDSPAFNTGMVFKKNRKRRSLTGPLKSMSVAIQTLAHPKKTAKAKAASRLALDDQPFLHPEADDDLLQAHDDLDQAESNSDYDPRAHAAHKKRLEDMERERDEMRAAWVTSKHVRRVKVVQKGYLSFPTMAEYEELDSAGVYVQMQWGRYLAHLLLYVGQDFASQYIDDSNQMVFKRSLLIRTAERFYVSTGPWQSWLMKIRKVYRWDDPWLTGRLLALYLFLIKTGYVMTYFYAYVVYIVVKGRFVRESIQSIRESQQRALDRSAQVLKISELIRRHGEEDWLDEFLDEAGPLMQQQLGDVADYLEILYNFYSWRDPLSTASSLCFWCSCVLVSAFSSAEYASKIFWFVCGLYFFFSRPIASKFPKYRKAVSLFRWIYWEIPTFAELAFRQLRHQAEENRTRLVEQTADDLSAAHIFDSPSWSNVAEKGFSDTSESADDPENSHDDGKSDSDGLYQDSSESEDRKFVSKVAEIVRGQDIIAFHGRCRNKRGWIIVHTSGVRFTETGTLDLPFRSNKPTEGNFPSSGDQRELWNRPYDELVEMRKSKNRSKYLARKKLVPAEALTLVWTDGTEDTVWRMPRRDEAFNTLLGFSTGRWMELPPRAEDIGGNQNPLGPLDAKSNGNERTACLAHDDDKASTGS